MASSTEIKRKAYSYSDPAPIESKNLLKLHLELVFNAFKAASISLHHIPKLFVLFQYKTGYVAFSILLFHKFAKSGMSNFIST